MNVNLGMLTEVCHLCGECLYEEWGFWSHPEDFDWGIPSEELSAAEPEPR